MAENISEGAKMHASYRLTETPLPEITDGARDYARSHPDSWIYYTDHTLPDGAPVTTENVIGGRCIGTNGEFTGETWVNDQFLPQPAFAKRRFHAHLDLVLWRVLHGYTDLGGLAEAFAEASPLVVVDPDEENAPQIVEIDGKRAIFAFTSRELVPDESDAVREIPGRQLFDLGATDPELWIELNPSEAGQGLRLRLLIQGLGTVLGLLPQLAQESAARQAEQPGADTQQPQPAAQAQSAEAPPDAHERFMGSMLAGAVGDALGYAIEFHDIGLIRQHYGDAGLTAPVLRDGVAQISDDTQMMLFTLEGLIRAHVARRINPSDNDPVPEVQHAYQRWFHTQNQPWERAGGPYTRHLRQPDGWLITHRELFSARAPGSTCMSALANFAQTHRHASPQFRINDSKGSGGVMRAAPVAVWSNDPAEVFYAAVGTAALTHSHPSGFLSAGVLAVIVHQLIRAVPLPESVRMARDLLLRWRGHEEQLQIIDAAVELAKKGPVTPEELKDALGQGWVGEEALAIGLYAVLATDNLRDALLLSVNHSGDSDSTGIVCGNIAGAIYGTRAIPPDWLATLELRELVAALAKDALVEFSPGPPTDPGWTRRYPAW
ncbi:ADP-ribosylglycohydrolase family protein [Saccharopolyspora phatthalungensis]|uniref:ADP-ribosylglycohydrolase n=1 Tax=Saccharopolyspora phatthalungensis TaxID=664693 RepID=A0A840QCV2_9PSEU|nr:ADP-ribosylglycohydrolase family protein [Saccharopolyspora phatthalungensis]MBB5154743.1 ADP-ribosylglycohydrolase [Saccharopolyspora phatthalungensis]